MCVYSHKRQMHFQQLSCIRNNFGDQPARPAPTSAPPRNPGFGQARLRLRRATRARVGASRDRHGAPRQSRGCAPLRAGRPRSQGTAALSGDAARSQGTAALPGDGCAPRGRLRSQGGCAPRGRRRRSQGTAAAFSGDGCGVLRERLRSQGTAALSGDGCGVLRGRPCAPRERLRSQGTAALSRGRLRRSQGTAALPGDGCAPRGGDAAARCAPRGRLPALAPGDGCVLRGRLLEPTGRQGLRLRTRRTRGREPHLPRYSPDGDDRTAHRGPVHVPRPRRTAGPGPFHATVQRPISMIRPAA